MIVIDAWWRLHKCHLQLPLLPVHVLIMWLRDSTALFLVPDWNFHIAAVGVKEKKEKKKKKEKAGSGSEEARPKKRKIDDDDF